MSNLASRLAASESASSTILAKDRTLSCDTRQTGLNNNALVIGPSGAGKTRNVLKPNLLQMNASYIVLDTKGTLCREVGPVLAAHGYRVQCLNFADLTAKDTYLSAERAVELGFAHEILSTTKEVAHV